MFLSTVRTALRRQKRNVPVVYGGVKVMGGYQPVNIKSFQGAVIAEVEMDEVLRPFYRQLTVIVALYFAMILVALPLAYWLAKRIKLPSSGVFYFCGRL